LATGEGLGEDAASLVEAGTPPPEVAASTEAPLLDFHFLVTDIVGDSGRFVPAAAPSFRTWTILMSGVGDFLGLASPAAANIKKWPKK
jgi:hypothetical protein